MHRYALGLFFFSTLVAAQQPWQGEWGAYTGQHAEEARRLTIQGCSATPQGATCKFDLEVDRPGGNAGTSIFQILTVQSSATATASLPGEQGQAACQLAFTRLGGPNPKISVTATGKSCTSYYATAADLSMSGTYPFRSASLYGGSQPNECFLDSSPARLAICTHPDIATLEGKWSDLADEYALQPPSSKDQSESQHADQLEAGLLHNCDPDPNPAACLRSHFAQQVGVMQAKQDAYLQGTTDRGDPVEGGKLARMMAGRYRHREPNGDVQGHSYTSTDTLTIRPVGASSIHFSTELNFFNGHVCSLSGGALYRKDGSFVFDDSSANTYANEPVCRLAIIPTATGVDFKDITGGCKAAHCGERGSWDGEAFTFKERLSPPAAR